MDEHKKTSRLVDALRREGADLRAEAAAANEKPAQAADESVTLTTVMSTELASNAQACTAENGDLPTVDVEIHHRKELSDLLERAQIEGCADTAAKIIAFETARQGTPFIETDPDTQAEYDVYAKRREFAGDGLSDFTMLINILTQFQNNSEEERAAWCEANYLQLEILEAVLHRYNQVLEYYESQDIQGGENNSEEDAVGRSICAGYRYNLMSCCVSNFRDVRYSPVFELGRSIRPDASSVMHFPERAFTLYHHVDYTLDLPKYSNLIVASKPRAAGVRGIAMGHPVKNEWIYQLAPEWIRQTVRYNFRDDSFSADVTLKQGEHTAGICLGILDDIPREQEDCRNAFALAIINCPELQKFLLEFMGITEKSFFLNELRRAQRFLEIYFGYECFDYLFEQRTMILSDFVVYIYRKKLQGIEASKDALAARVAPTEEDPLDLFITSDEFRAAAAELNFELLRLNFQEENKK